MQANDSAAEKRTAVEYLSFGAKTAKRVTWEAWEFTVVGPHTVEVTNASYGFEKDDHAYEVGVEERDGVPVPAECGCPADQYNENYDCKHKVALATVGGPTVLNAALAFEDPTPAAPDQETETVADHLRADGGPGEETSETDECACATLSGEFPCAECYIGGAKSFPEGPSEGV